MLTELGGFSYNLGRGLAEPEWHTHHLNRSQGFVVVIDNIVICQYLRVIFQISDRLDRTADDIS